MSDPDPFNDDTSIHHSHCLGDGFINGPKVEQGHIHHPQPSDRAHLGLLYKVVSTYKSRSYAHAVG